MSGHWRWVRRASAPHQAVQPPYPADSSSGHTAATGSAGAEALDALLGEVRDLRLTFVADLSMAAGAVEAGATDVAADIIDADRTELARFFRAADERLRELELAAYRDSAREAIDPVPANTVPANVVPMRPRSRARRRVALALPAVPLVGALTMAAAAAAGIVPLPGRSAPSSAHHGTAAIAAENNALRQFETVVNSDPSAQQVIAAADKLHQQIVALIATSNGDPAQANAIARLLQMERALLLSKRPPGAQVVLAATGSLITQLHSHATPIVTPIIASPKPAAVAPQPTSTSTAKSSPSPSPSKTAKPSPTPTHSSSPSPSPSSSSSSDSGPLPKVGG
jgi:hypothetical protein